jgi:hypothetical protein
LLDLTEVTGRAHRGSSQLMHDAESRGAPRLPQLRKSSHRPLFRPGDTESEDVLVCALRNAIQTAVSYCALRSDVLHRWAAVSAVEGDWPRRVSLVCHFLEPIKFPLADTVFEDESTAFHEPLMLAPSVVATSWISVASPTGES